MLDQHPPGAQLVFTARTDANGDARFDLSTLTRGAVEIAARAMSSQPYRSRRESITGPDWVRGCTVVEVSHQEGGPRQSLVRLQVDEGGAPIPRERRSPRLPADPRRAQNAFVARQAIDLHVDSVEDGA